MRAVMRFSPSGIVVPSTRARAHRREGTPDRDRPEPGGGEGLTLANRIVVRKRGRRLTGRCGVLHDVSIEVRDGEDRGPARHQRQRQEHAHQVHHGHGAARGGRDLPWRSTVRGVDLTRKSTEEIVGLGISRWCRRAAGSSRSSRWRRNLLLGGLSSPRPARRHRGQPGLRLRGLSGSWPAAGRQLGGQHERRRAADAGGLAGARSCRPRRSCWWTSRRSGSPPSW